MSILGANLNSQDVVAAIVQWGIIAVAVTVAAALRVFRPAMVVGPERLSRRQSTLPLVAATGAGLMVWVMAGLPGAFRRLNAAHGVADHVTITPADWAFLATVPPLAGFATLWLADFFVGGLPLLNRLGLSLRRLLPGIARGILATVVILPTTMLVMYLVQLVYTRLHYIHPAEHDLLKVMGQSQSAALQWILALGAAVAAPLWEEFLFRGHIQTLIRRTLVTFSTPRLPGMEGYVGYSPIGAPILVDPIPLVDVVEPPHVWQTWVAIIVTSCIFAGFHDAWTRPIIFFLALGLGYCYERTGNLWVNITVHCLFNSVQTLFYLFVLHQ